MEQIIYHPVLLRLERVLQSIEGKDKIARLAQYLSRYLAFYYLGQGKRNQIILFTNLRNTISIIRKYIRFFECFQYLNNINDIFRSGNDKIDLIVKHLSVIKNFFYFFYLLFDSMFFLNLLKMLNLKRKDLRTLRHLVNINWFMGIFSNILVNIRRHVINHRKLQSATGIGRSSSEDDQLEVKKYLDRCYAERHSIRRRLLWDALDLAIVASRLNIVKVNEGYLGLAGVLTSVLALQDIYQK
ncbi:Pex11p [Ascoidea rubescens DSM 1968]|uniref:Peroxisomal biogenesis factor 11 n=1 Tax=Ascoidea rubescens DSM 1968 TaxID=1344418 RepID=A0A1D2VMN7_9ASCO|nr:peroxisomal biogenesis factor 11 [Ascoidea rubescens DSM 1968]ODV62815.1 peroxisomal biogenesis factor 11 [Ascoidea rubescens DSM 1968]